MDWMSAGDSRALGGFVLRFAMPALIFKALASRPIGEIADIRYIAAYAGASLACFVLVYALFSREAGARPAMRALGGSSPNSGFVGFPAAALADPGTRLRAPIRPQEHDPALVVERAQHQHLRPDGTDLARREIDDADHQRALQLVARVVGDLRR